MVTADRCSMRRGACLALSTVLLSVLWPVMALDSEESAFLSIINDYRAANSLGPLTLSPTLTVASELHSQDMADQNYFSHYSLDGRSPFDRMVDAGYDYPTCMGENIAAGYVTAADVFVGWKNSPGHDANMLYSDFVTIGIGRAYNVASTYKWYWTTDFGGYDDSGTPPPPPPVQVSSPTHPNPDLWYPNSDSSFIWDPISGAEGYSHMLDQNPTSTPDMVIDSTDNSESYVGLGDGTWYFHIRAKTASDWGPTTHLRIKVDRTPPAAPVITSITHPDQGSKYPIDDPVFTWSTPPDASGIYGYSYVLDDHPGTEPDAIADTHSNGKSYTDVQEGVWYFHVRARDNAGNWGSTSHFMITISLVPVADFDASVRSGEEPLAVVFTDLSTSSSSIVNWTWSFGDGGTSIERNPVHIYERAGNYTVTLTVTESDGDFDFESKTDFIMVTRSAPDSELVDWLVQDWQPVFGAKTLARYISADAYVEPGRPEANNGHDPDLSVDPTGSRAYLRIDLDLPPGATPIEAGLGLYCNQLTGMEDAQIAILYCEDDAWSEGGLCWNNRPCGPCVELDRVAIVLPGSYVRINLSHAVAQGCSKGRATIVLHVPEGLGGAVFSSREGSQRPFVVIAYSMSEVHTLNLTSSEDSGLSANLGRICIDGASIKLPAIIRIAEGSYPVEYLPGFEFARWVGLGEVSLADQSSRVSSMVITGSGILEAHGSCRNVVYYFDDGTPEFPEGRPRGQMQAVRFTPSLAGVLKRIMIYFEQLCQPSSQNVVVVHVLDRCFTDIIPPISLQPRAEGWMTVEVPGEPVIVDDVIIALEYREDYCPRVGVDASGGGSSLIFDGVDWVRYWCNYMMRCEVESLEPPRGIARMDLAVDPETLRAGELMIIHGVLDPPLAGRPVTIALQSPDGSRTDLVANTTASGFYWLSHVPLKAGTWTIMARWEGDQSYLNASSDAVEFTVDRGSVHITCMISPTLGYFGQPITLWGTILPVSLPLTIEHRTGGGWEVLATVNTTANLTYTYSWLPTGVGAHDFRATWPGDEDFNYATSPASLYVLRAHSSITCILDADTITYGCTVNITGQLSPAIIAPVEIGYYSDSGWHELAIVWSHENGTYACNWKVETLGHLMVGCSWSGDANYVGAFSELAPLRVHKATSYIHCLVEPSQPQCDQQVTLRGTIRPIAAVTLTLTLESPSGSISLGSVCSDFSGEYSFDFVPDQEGRWVATVGWEGDWRTLGTRESVSFEVGQGQVKIECRVEPSGVRLGEGVMIRGYVSGPTTIGLEYRVNGGPWTAIVDILAPRGEYEHWWVPPLVGTYQVKALSRSEGQGATCNETPGFIVSKCLSSITLRLGEASTAYGQVVLISGVIEPPCAGPIFVECNRKGTWHRIAMLDAGCDGSYSFFWAVDFVGSADLRATWEGNNRCEAAESEIARIYSEKAASWVGCLPETIFVHPNQSVRIRGSIQPALSIAVNVNLTDPSGLETCYTAMANASGDFVCAVDLDQVGTWQVVAGWRGDDHYQGYWTFEHSLYVKAELDEARTTGLFYLLLLAIVTGAHLRHRDHPGLFLRAGTPSHPASCQAQTDR